MVTIDGTNVTEVTIDGTTVTEITIDGTVAYTSAPAETVLADFESGTWPGNWTGATIQFSHTTTAPIEGTTSVEATATNARVANANISTANSNTYRFRGQLATLSNNLDFFVHSQSTTEPLNDSYWLRLDPVNGRVVAWQRVGGVSTMIANSGNASVSYTAGATYTAVIDLPADPTVNNITISVEDSTGTTLASAAGTATHLYTSGVIGFGHVGPDAGDKFDYFTVV